MGLAAAAGAVGSLGVGGGLATAGGLSALGSIGSALIGSNAASSASGSQAQGDMIGLMLRQAALNMSSNALSPFIQGGQQSQSTLNALLNPGASQTATLQNLPGFQFASQWGNLATTNQLAAQGLGGSSGPLGKALSDYNNGLASTQFTNFANLLQNNVGSGENAANALSTAATGFGSGAASSTQNYGNALATGTLGSSNALQSGVNSLANAALVANNNGGIYSNLNLLANSGGAGSGNGWSMVPAGGFI